MTDAERELLVTIATMLESTAHPEGPFGAKIRELLAKIEGDRIPREQYRAEIAWLNKVFAISPETKEPIQ